MYGFGYDEELPAGYQDADLETLEFEEAARDMQTATPNALELEESGQTRIGVAGEQRSFAGMAPAVEPAVAGS